MAPPVCYFPPSPLSVSTSEPKPIRCVTPAEAGSIALTSHMLARAFVVYVRPKRSERHSAVDRAFGRARQARSTWPWSERAQVYQLV